MRAGQLRHRLAFFSPATQTANDYGETRNATPTTQVTVWGKVEPLTGSELEHARQLHALASHAVTVRYNATYAFLPTWHFTFNTRTFGVLWVGKTDEIGHEVRMLAREIVA